MTFILHQRIVGSLTDISEEKVAEIISYIQTVFPQSKPKQFEHQNKLCIGFGVTAPVGDATISDIKLWLTNQGATVEIGQTYKTAYDNSLRRL